MQTRRTSPASELRWFAVGIGMSTGVVGFCANAVVLAVLLKARRQFGSCSVNIFIVNQSLMDLLACFFVAVTMILLVTARSEYSGAVRVSE